MFLASCKLGRCYASTGVGWGGDENVPCTCTHGRCYATSCSLHLANLVDATQVLGWVGVGWGGDDNVPCTCTHGRCYATSCSLHLANLVDATQVLGWVGVGWGGDDNVPCTCTHGRCYVTSCSLQLANLVDATQEAGGGVYYHITIVALKKHRSLASRSFLSPSQVFKQPLWQVEEKRSHVLMKDNILFPRKMKWYRYFSSPYISPF